MSEVAKLLSVDDPVEAAARLYLSRHYLPSSHVEGWRRWPSPSEITWCCDTVPPPPLSHFRTLRHIATLCDVNVADLKREVKSLRARGFRRELAIAASRDQLAEFERRREEIKKLVAGQN